MKDNNLNAFFVGSLIASVVGAVMLLVDDFGGWYYQISFASVPLDRYGEVSLFSVYSPIVAVLAAAMLFSGYVSYLVLRSDEPEPSARLLRRAYSSSVAAFGATAVLAIIFTIVMSTQDVEDWWLGGGFYGAAVGSVLSAILLKLGLNKIVD